jgi:endonuclease/exonuclease/phosphatase (EEP) superfamily protein YafD
VEALILIVTFFSLVAFAGQLNCFVDLLAHFRVQYAIILLAAAAFALLLRAWRAAIVGVVGLGINAALIVPLYLPNSATLDEAIPPLKIVSFNVLYVNRRFDDVAAYLQEQQAEIILLFEVDDECLRQMITRLDGYRLVEGQGRDATFGLAMFVRESATELVVRKSELRDISGGVAGVDAVMAQMQWHGQPFALLGMHVCTPLTEATAIRRDAELAAAARWSVDQQGQGNATILMGDFNATPWSHVFRSLEQEGILTNSQRGFGVQPSFKSNWPALFGIPIDHCLHSKELKCVQRVVDPRGYGSDHRPLAVTLGWVE